MAKKIMYITGGLLLLVLVEGILTLGCAFQFSQYSIFAWVVQVLAVLFTVSCSLHLEGMEDTESIFS